MLSSPARRCLETAELLTQLQAEEAGGRTSPPRVLVLQELRNLEMGLWEGQPMRLVRTCV